MTELACMKNKAIEAIELNPITKNINCEHCEILSETLPALHSKTTKDSTETLNETLPALHSKTTKDSTASHHLGFPSGCHRFHPVH